MGEFYELRNFMNTWSQEEQQQQELHESFVNRLYECKPVKRVKKAQCFSAKKDIFANFLTSLALPGVGPY